MTTPPANGPNVVRTGVHLPNYGGPASAPGVRAIAELIEGAGFDSIWLSDHVVLPDEIRSRYPFSRDGGFFLPAADDWFEWTVTAGYIAAVTQRLDIGIGVAVAPLRHPLLLAKQAATIDRLSGGRMLLGLGAGWLTEEITALGGDPSHRGVALNEGLRLMRAAWTGHAAAGAYGPYELPDGIHCQPRPVRDPLPVYIGGTSRAAARRIARSGQGWYGAGPDGAPTVTNVAAMREKIDKECAAIGRDPAEIEIALRLTVPARQLGTSELADRFAALADAGVDRLSFDLGWKPDTKLMHDRLAALLSAIPTTIR